jgi:hypothetical protein
LHLVGAYAFIKTISYKDLISRIAIPWVLLHNSMEDNRADYRKMLARRLLQTASSLEKACVNCDDEKRVSDLQQHSLSMQQESILLSLVRWNGLNRVQYEPDLKCISAAIRALGIH